MEPTGTIVVSALVGAAIGYAIAKLTFHPACPPHRIVVNPTNTPTNLGDIYVCKQAAHSVRWESTTAAKITVAWTGPAPHPYPLSGCGSATSNSCDSGALSSTAVVGPHPFEMKIGGQPWNGRIIIDK